MKIGIDKNSINIVKKKNNEYIYLYDDEEYKDLLKLKIHCLNYRYCDYVDINLTDYDVDCLKKAKITDEDFDKLIKINFKIAIIIPNYNYEHTIEKCLKSILDQTYTNYEIIFIDDVSTDGSVEIAKRLLRPQDKLIQLKQKRLNGGARNEGYLYVSEDTDYIYYVDSDDWLFDNQSLEKINNRLQSKPDVLFVGIAEYKHGRIKTSSIPEYSNKYQAMAGWSGSCGKVIKKELATRQECLYNEGTLKEDRNQHYKICINMNDFKLLKDLVYVWNKENYKSVTKTRNNLWKASTIRHYADTMELYLTYKGQDSRLDEILEERLMLCKKEIDEGNDRQY